MNNKIIETLEGLEDKIENIKWLISGSFFTRKTGISEVTSIIRRTAGILYKGPKGTAFENEVRKEWEKNSRRRMS